MPILASRMVAVISAARSWEAAWRSLHDLTVGAVLRHSRGEITTEQLYAELGANAAATEPGAVIQITLATEEQHFNRSHRHNEKSRARMERLRQGQGLAKTEGRPELTELPIPLGPKHLQPIPKAVADHARAAAKAFAPGVDPFAGFPAIDGPTPAELAADEAMTKDPSYKEESLAHLAAIRKGDQ